MIKTKKINYSPFYHKILIISPNNWNVGKQFDHIYPRIP